MASQARVDARSWDAVGPSEAEHGSPVHACISRAAAGEALAGFLSAAFGFTADPGQIRLRSSARSRVGFSGPRRCGASGQGTLSARVRPSMGASSPSISQCWRRLGVSHRAMCGSPRPEPTATEVQIVSGSLAAVGGASVSAFLVHGRSAGCDVRLCFWFHGRSGP